MGRAKKPFKYYFRQIGDKNIWYYSISPASGVPVELCEDRKSSQIEVELDGLGKPKRSSEQKIVRFCLNRIRELKASPRSQYPTLAEFLRPYFTPECPHITRLLSDGNRYSDTFRKDQRSRIDRLVLTHRLSEFRMDELSPGDFEDFKKDLRKKGVGTRTINLTVGAVRTAINEGIHRGDIKTDPTVGVGNIRSDEDERGIFSIDEIRNMFSIPEGFQAWGYDDNYHGSPTGEKILPIVPYTLAILMFATGERPSAILRLNWEDVDGDMITFRVTKAAGARSIPIVTMATKALRELSDSMMHVAPADPVFCHDDTGQRLTYAFFPKRFAHMMATLGLPADDADGRKRTPYSLKSSLITHLIDGGADPILVREYVGHSHGTGEKRLTRVQSRYKKAQRERLKILLPDIEVLLSAESVTTKS